MARIYTIEGMDSGFLVDKSFESLRNLIKERGAEATENPFYIDVEEYQSYHFYSEGEDMPVKWYDLPNVSVEQANEVLEALRKSEAINDGGHGMFFAMAVEG